AADPLGTGEAHRRAHRGQQRGGVDVSYDAELAQVLTDAVGGSPVSDTYHLGLRHVLAIRRRRRRRRVAAVTLTILTFATALILVPSASHTSVVASDAPRKGVAMVIRDDNGAAYVLSPPAQPSQQAPEATSL